MKKILGTLMLTCALATSMAVLAQSDDQMKRDAPQQDSMKNDQMKKEKKPKKAAKKDQERRQHETRRHEEGRNQERRDEAELAAIRHFSGAGNPPAPLISRNNLAESQSTAARIAASRCSSFSTWAPARRAPARLRYFRRQRRHGTYPSCVASFAVRVLRLSLL